jgi:PAS domain S-box-containing protein
MASGYTTQLVVLSILIACAASYAALYLASHVAHTRARATWLIAAAAAMGTGIWSMHFIAMLAYRLPVQVGYDVPLVGLSLLIAIVASGIGLEVAGRERASPARIAMTGPVMGFAIAGMHYTGMAAMRLPASQHYNVILVVASIVVAVAASYAAVALFLRFRFDASRRGEWLKAASAIVMGHAVAGMHYTAMAAVHFEHGNPSVAGLVLPPDKLATAVAAATTLILAIVVAGAMVDRWARTARAIRESEERFRAMVDAVHDYAIFTVDPGGRISSWNRGAERLLGYTPDEILGQSLRRLFPEGQEQNADQELSIAASAGQYESEGIRITKGGVVRRVNVTTTAMRDAHGELIGYARILRDVTEKLRAQEELRRSEEQLRQSQKMEAVGQLAGGVAHDFNNMLTAIRGYADLLLVDGVRSADDRDAIGEIRKAADRAAALTRQLLAYSRKQMLQPRAVNPNDIVREMEGMLRRLLVGDVELVTRFDDSVGQITVDPAQLEQVILNLVLNARDAMPSGGRIMIETSLAEFDAAFCEQNPGAHPGRHVVLMVRDNGRGIPEQIRQHIFEPFFTTKERGAGTGLGLSTVYGIVKQSGGYVAVESAAGSGATFRIAFPQTGQQTSPDATAAAPEPARSSGETVLVVDDEDGVRRMLTLLLERRGYRVLAANGGTQALDISDTYPGRIALLITDVMMPRMNGKELSERLIAKRPGLRVLFMSGYTDHQIIERGLIDAETAFIQKPFSTTEFTDKVHELLPISITLAEAG